ncbi:GPI ethanolamine phosphate transferase 2 [Halyomorpha halys]|uniref:GPI ethanolamine phosphate transferase 2 n=1 Tax=Halyomorpha halys TaxID=286706 RepID=UPI0006D4DEE0|nr:GPI ethanolamine phosphate transferase 2 [Halyomorpha halys]
MVLLRLQYTYVYFMILQILALVAFLLGFFPVKTLPNRNASHEDLPSTIKDMRVSPRNLYHRHINRLILLVIDGMRFDFINGEGTEENMPFVSSIINKSDNCLLKVRVETPTVTMPRIKALMTGNIPSFLDIIRNFKTNEVTEDNILRQASKNGFSPVFYGDETWVNLFPHEFIRKEITTSFYVNDFFEVDDNVTRNLKKELTRADWDIMILHYLGLDHIGHVEGPKSMHIKPKLNEMDNVISLIFKDFIQTGINGSDMGNVLIVCGDHGMHDSGGHGGSSLPEVLVPFFLVNHYCGSDMRNEELSQIDITPLISVLLGLPIPAANLGKLDYRLLKKMEPLSKLYAMYYSTRSLKKIFEDYHFNIHSYPEALKNLQEADNLFELFIQNGPESTIENKSLYHYFEVQKVMSDKMSQLNINFDFYLMFISSILLIQIWWILLKGCRLVFNMPRISISLFSLAFLGIFKLFLCNISPGSSFLCSNDITSQILPVLLTTIFSFNILLLPPRTRIFMVSFDVEPPLLFLILLHLLSYTSSSYIEEEHQFWYFFLTTLFLYIIISNAAYSCIIPLLVHRFLRKLNQTGNKWAFIPDIGDWLNEENHMTLLLIVYISGQLVLIYWFIKHVFGKNVKKWALFLEKMLFLLQILLITLYRFSIGNLKFLVSPLPESRGITEVKLFWSVLAVQLVLYIFSINFKNSKNNFMLNIIEIILVLTVEIIALLHKPHNIVLISAMLVFQDILAKYYLNHVYYLMGLYQSLGMVFYFYQGNSNGLASIDITAGFIGLEEFSLTISGVYVFLNTFSAIILANILLLRTMYLSKSKAEKGKYWTLYKDNLQPLCVYDEELEYYWFIPFVSCSYAIFYSTYVVLQRHHLFLWSVFCPKLLYLSCEILLYSIIVFMLFFLESSYIVIAHFF